MEATTKLCTHREHNYVFHLSSIILSWELLVLFLLALHVSEHQSQIFSSSCFLLNYSVFEGTILGSFDLVHNCSRM